MSSTTYPLVDTGFYFDSLATAYTVRGLVLTHGKKEMHFYTADKELTIQDMEAVANNPEFDRMARNYKLPDTFFDPHIIQMDFDVDFGAAPDFEGDVETATPSELGIDESEDVLYNGESVITENLSSEYIIWQSLRPCTLLGPAPYHSIDEIIQEIKDAIGLEVVDTFPDDFDWRKRICTINGTYYC